MNLKYSVATVLTIALFATAPGAFAQGTTPSATTGAKTGATASNPDRKFAETAASAGMAEVEMGKVAQQRGGSDVKAFADRMVTDHGKANQELTAIAGAKNIKLPAGLSGKDQRELGKLQKLTGGGFDAEYVKSQVAAHKDAVALFKRESSSGKDTDLKAFAGKTLPTLQEHLTMVTALSKKAP
jgi:putative membrane protein